LVFEKGKKKYVRNDVGEPLHRIMLRQAMKMGPAIQAAARSTFTRALSGDTSSHASNGPDHQGTVVCETREHWAWVNDPNANPRLITLEGLGAGMDLDKMDDAELEEELFASAIAFDEEHPGQPQKELLSDDRDM